MQIDRWMKPLSNVGLDRHILRECFIMSAVFPGLEKLRIEIATIVSRSTKVRKEASKSEDYQKSYQSLRTPQIRWKLQTAYFIITYATGFSSILPGGYSIHK